MDFTLTSGHVVTLDADGISSISYLGTQIAAGNVMMLDGSWFYTANSNWNYNPVIATKTVVFNPTGATVTHNYTGIIQATVVYVYVISGSDIQISVAIYNRGTASIPIQVFQSPRFLFSSFAAAVASSNLLGYSQSNTRNLGTKLTYPCNVVPFGASYVITTTSNGTPINFCTWSTEDPFDKWFVMGFGVGGGSLPGVSIGNFFFKEVRPGAFGKCSYTFRFSASTDWQVLMQGYKDYLRARCPLLYDPDARPWARFTSINTAYIRPDNPYGYNDGGGVPAGIWRRLDKLAGCQDFVARLLPPILDGGYAGVICWQPQGIHPRGVQYRPDFDVWPPVSIPNLPTLFNGFINAGKRFGLQGRPSATITSGTWDIDSLIRMTDPQDALDDLTLRLNWATSRGISAMYLDSFVSDGGDHNILKYMRTLLGSGFQLYTEFPTALTLHLSGTYHEFAYVNGNYRFLLGYDIYRYLYPETIWFSNFIGTLPPGGDQANFTYMFQNKLTPMIEDYEVFGGPKTAMIKLLVAQYINSSNHWI